MLSEQTRTARLRNVTASGAHRVMGDWNKKPPSPDGIPAFDQMEPVLRKIHEEGKSIPTATALRPLLSDPPKALAEPLKEAWKVITYNPNPITQGMDTYAQELVDGEFFHYDEDYAFTGNYATRAGEEREPECMRILGEKVEKQFVWTGDNQQHIDNGEGVGCTPDGVLLGDNELVYTGGEAKCKSPSEHRYLYAVTDNDTLKKLEFNIFCQVQCSMYVLGCTYWFFAIYQPKAKDDRLKFKYTVIERDSGFIRIMESRIKATLELRDKHSAATQKLLES